MSWLESNDRTRRTPGSPVATPNENPLQRDFLNRTVVVETDFDTGDLVVDESDGYRWVTAYPTFELLEQIRGWSETLNHAQLTGRQLRNKVPADVGVMYRANRDDEITISWPRIAPISRVAVQ